VQGKVYDLAIIGGGINGAAIARDAAGRGLSVFLCEAGDLGSGSSSATGKIVHGGLRHMEGPYLGAMREAVTEREILLRSAPHLVRVQRFVVPHHHQLASRIVWKAGLRLYDLVGKTSLPQSRALEWGSELLDRFHDYFNEGFEFHDCIVDDSRLVILNAVDAQARGALICPRLRCVIAERDGERWRLSLESTQDGQRLVVLAGMLVNAAGAAASDVLNHVAAAGQPMRARVSKGCHLVVRHEHDPEIAFALPAASGRFVYVTPYGDGTVLVSGATGTHRGGAAPVEVTDDDVDHLLDVVADYFHEPIASEAVVQRFACFRALPEDRGSVSRGRAIVADAPPRAAPLISVFGGDFTTHRRLAEQVVDRLATFRAIPSPAWTTTAVLPGGGFPADTMPGMVRALTAAYPFVTRTLAERLVRAYGTRASAILTGARTAADLGAAIVGDMTEAELRFLRNEEWAETAEDVLWRRSKLGFVATPEEVAALEAFMAGEAVPAATVA
jgi:glycerol-3-phosphate dehydrogenase